MTSNLPLKRYVRVKKGVDPLNEGGYSFVWVGVPPEISDPENYDVHEVTISLALKSKPSHSTEAVFDAWWSADGMYIDPDTDDVPWFDKRRGLAMAAFQAGLLSPNQSAATETDVERAQKLLNILWGGVTNSDGIRVIAQLIASVRQEDATGYERGAEAMRELAIAACEAIGDNSSGNCAESIRQIDIPAPPLPVEGGKQMDSLRWA